MSYLKTKIECLKDFLNLGKSKPCENEYHIKAAIIWIYKAQDVTKDGGVSRMYDLRRGWGASYPETTGYIIPTLFDYYHLSGDLESRGRAINLAKWESNVQMENGAIQAGTVNSNPKVPTIFNTGQVIFGWVRAYKETGDKKFYNSAEKASEWLVETQDEDGAWRKYSSSVALPGPNTYNTRTAWALLKAYSVISKEKYLVAARKNIDWAITQQLDNGWFKNNCLTDNDRPLLHTIAYAIRGILESGVVLNDNRYLELARIPADILISLQRNDGSLAGRFDSNWRPTVRWSCLTGDAQISIIWLRLFEIFGKEKYYLAGKRINNYLKSVQDIKTKNKNIYGGIKGSYPIYGDYGKYQYLNWAAKFFIDALILEERVSKKFSL
ncbi:MAG: hypothetical protein A2042_01490 [Candidatus Schekmanbacteria bacterium GWA2_38_11]|uniref:Squalene cyclase C-terminal domain-containing protein n=1 Tax=Candidatus Schekmanbacteria bacterium GWA2_38_11 TaxID=1817876 RepID=A0A1F7RJG0_9BACT|nr:MAG: hypothetical protein A2042_01490 [Candidatus Schekmanbacteria bacterium GWA2_38_11]